MGQYYQNTPSASREITEQKPPTLSERFMARAREYADAGRDNSHWLGCADIARRLEQGKPVGHYRRKNKRHGKPWPQGINPGASARTDGGWQHD